MKSGYVAIIGRPNSGKSTLLNNILKNKVSITSPKPQTTRFNIQAVYEDTRGQIIFIDTPGIFAKVKDTVSKRINPLAQSIIGDDLDIIIHLVDHTRDRDIEENKILGLIRQFKKPKILAVNKIDIEKPSYLPHYKFMEEEYERVVSVSAFYRSNLNLLLDAVFEFLPRRKKIVDISNRPTPVLNISGRTFIAEIIREKAYLFLRKEIPYTLTVVVDEVTDRKDGIKFIKGRIITDDDRYKKMIIGERGRMIKEIGQAARKELETATGQKIFVNLTVEVNPHWHELYL